MMIYSRWGGEKNKPTAACFSAAASRINSQGVKKEEDPGRNCWMAKTNVSELGNVHSWLFLWCRAGGGGKPGQEECGRVAVDLIRRNLHSLNWAQSWNQKLLLFSLCWHLSQSFRAIALLTAFMVGCHVIICIAVFIPLYSFRGALNTFQRVKRCTIFFSNEMIMSCVLASYMLIYLEE